MNAQKYGHRYPWDDWFARGRFTLRQGADYHYRTDTMIQQVRNNASRRGLGVSVTVAPAGQSFTVTVLRNGDGASG